jgi:hypothetical protein
VAVIDWIVEAAASILGPNTTSYPSNPVTQLRRLYVYRDLPSLEALMRGWGRLGNASHLRDELGGVAGIANHSTISRSTVKLPDKPMRVVRNCEKDSSLSSGAARSGTRTSARVFLSLEILMTKVRIATEKMSMPPHVAHGRARQS